MTEESVRKSQGNRLGEVIDYLKASNIISSQADLLRKMNVSIKGPTLTSYLNGNRNCEGFVYKLVDRFPFVSKDYILNGSGEMTKGGETDNINESKSEGEVKSPYVTMLEHKVRDLSVINRDLTVIQVKLNQELIDKDEEIKELKEENKQLRNKVFELVDQVTGKVAKGA